MMKFLLSWINIMSILSILLGVRVILTGEFKKGLIFLNDERYFVGMIFIFFGLYLIFISIKKEGSFKS